MANKCISCGLTYEGYPCPRCHQIRLLQEQNELIERATYPDSIERGSEKHAGIIMVFMAVFLWFPTYKLVGFEAQWQKYLVYGSILTGLVLGYAWRRILYTFWVILVGLAIVAGLGYILGFKIG